jgi:starch synthase
VAKRSFVEMGVAADKVHVIPYGVRLEAFRKTAEPPSDRFEMLFAGQVSLRKGIPYLLDAFSRLKHPNKRLTIAGSVQPDLKAVLGRFPLEKVEFLGSITQPELAARMSRSHLLVLPSIEEGLALVQAQAMACGCPVLAARNTGAEDLFTDGVEGFIVPIRDADALLERMEELAQNPAQQRRMSEAALRRVRELGGWNHYGDLWESLLISLVGQKR